MSSLITNPLASTTTPPQPATTETGGSSTTPAASKDMFLRLLVAQLKNQDPASPADGTQFVAELATFTEVENSTQMVSDLNSIRTLLSPTPLGTTSGGTAAPGTTPTPGTAATPPA